MSSRAPWRAWLLALICAAVLWTRVGGVHLHLCFDGGEAPSSLHLSDAAHHQEDHGGHHGADEVHSDIDLQLADQPLTKPGKLVQDLTLLLFAALCLAFLHPARARVARGEPPLRWAASIAWRLPPLRGPPGARQGLPAQVQ